jgi:hypothetical protein
MSQFVTRTFAGGVTDIALQTGAEEWVRSLYMGNLWNSIRIGILQAINPISTTNLPANFGFVIGVCSGTNSPYGAASTTNFIGVNFSFSGAGGLYTAGAGNPWYAFNGLSSVITRVGTTITSATLGSGYNFGFPVQGVGTQRRWITLVDIIRGSPNYTVRVQDPQSSGSSPSVATDYSVTDLLTGMPQAAPVVVGGTTFGNHANTIVASELAGPFDTVNIYTNLPGYPGETYEVAVQKLS